MNNADVTFHPLSPGSVKLLPSIFTERARLNRNYLLGLKNEDLLQNHYLEAGLWNPTEKPKGGHWGWESPTSQVRGHFLGHWLSAAAHSVANTGDLELKARADTIVAELGRCQRENGGEWVGSIPEKYLDWLARGKSVWAPQYIVQKTMMGLFEMATLTGSRQAFEILERSARWFHRWTGQFTRDQLDQMMETETGGMLELWANLYGLTGERRYYELMQRYDRRRLFDPLIAGKEMLTNMHANTTIPEAQGAARAWEVTGEERWRQAAEAYWRSAVTERGAFCTGGQTSGEIWTPPFRFLARLGDKTQEHCVVYNMMRLSDYLLRWSGSAVYADYWERNLVNGILAQQHPDSGMVAYYLPLRAGSTKEWGTPTETFWCCHGTLVQAHTIYAEHIYYQETDGLVLMQYIPNDLVWERAGAAVKLSLTHDSQEMEIHRPLQEVFHLSVQSEIPQEFTIKLRVPWWVKERAVVRVNDEPAEVRSGPSSYISLTRTWTNDRVRVELPKALTAIPLPDDPEMVAFMDGPVVLAGLLENSQNPDANHLLSEWALTGDQLFPETMLSADGERMWGNWQPGYRTRRQAVNFRLIPLYEVRNERYQVYFPILPV